MENDKYLLQNAPNKFLKKFLPFIEKMVNNFVKRDMLQPDTAPNIIKKLKNCIISDLLSEIQRCPSTKINFLSITRWCQNKCCGIVVDQHIGTIKKRVNYYIVTGSFAESRREELERKLLETFLTKKTVQKFTDRSKFSTFFWACCGNHLNEILRKEKGHQRKNKEKYKSGADNDWCIDEQAIMDSPAFKKEMPVVEPTSHKSFNRAELYEKLEDLVRSIPPFVMNAEDRAKLKFIVLVKAKISITKTDITNFWQDCPTKVCRELLNAFGGNYEHIDEKDIWINLALFLSKKEGNTVSADALRIWAGRKFKLIHRI